MNLHTSHRANILWTYSLIHLIDYHSYLSCPQYHGEGINLIILLLISMRYNCDVLFNLHCNICKLLFWQLSVKMGYSHYLLTNLKRCCHLLALFINVINHIIQQIVSLIISKDRTGWLNINNLPKIWEQWDL